MYTAKQVFWWWRTDSSSSPFNFLLSLKKEDKIASGEIVDFFCNSPFSGRLAGFCSCLTVQRRVYWLSIYSEGEKRWKNEPWMENRLFSFLSSCCVICFSYFAGPKNEQIIIASFPQHSFIHGIDFFLSSGDDDTNSWYWLEIPMWDNLKSAGYGITNRDVLSRQFKLETTDEHKSC